MRATWQGDLAAPARYSVRAGLQRTRCAPTLPPPAPDASGHAQPGLPSFENLGGGIEATDAGGTLRLAARDASLVFPGVFEAPRLGFTRLAGVVHWSVAQPAAARRARCVSSR